MTFKTLKCFHLIIWKQFCSNKNLFKCFNSNLFIERGGCHSFLSFFVNLIHLHSIFTFTHHLFQFLAWLFYINQFLSLLLSQLNQTRFLWASASQPLQNPTAPSMKVFFLGFQKRTYFIFPNKILKGFLFYSIF